MVANLGLLGWFKYANLFVESWNDVAPWPVEWERVVLPVGISFFTFQSMSYTIDVYRGDVKPTRSFLDLLCFVSMFPQLVAGPIVRYRDIAAARWCGGSPTCAWRATACCCSRSASPRRC